MPEPDQPTSQDVAPGVTPSADAAPELDAGTNRVHAYTDGACKGNPGRGGWGVLLQWGERERELFGGAADTTNNRMELMAVIAALEALTRPVSVDIITDSQYVKRGVTEWMPRWKRNGWRTADRRPVKNRDLWERLDTALASHRVRWRWVKGHAGEPGNERADALANRGVQSPRGA